MASMTMTNRQLAGIADILGSELCVSGSELCVMLDVM